MAWYPVTDSNRRASSCKEAALSRLSYPPIFGTLERIRTSTGQALDLLPLPLGYERIFGRPSRIRTETFTGSEPMPSANWGKGLWNPRKESNLRRTVRNRMLSPLSYRGLSLVPTEGIEPPPRDS